MKADLYMKRSEFVLQCLERGLKLEEIDLLVNLAFPSHLCL